MTDDTLIQAGDDKLIGVGMGGSCPSCRAPIDLGQEFCLECGAPIRFSTRQRKGRGSSAGSTAGGATTPTAPRSFPWLPFGIVLALIVGGIAFAVVGTGDNASSKKEPSTKTQTALPEITNANPENEDTTDTTGAAAGACPTGLPSDGTSASGTSDPNASTGGTPGEQIPEVASPGMMGSNDPSADAFPSASDPGASDAVPSTDGSSAADANCTPGTDGATGGSVPTDGSAIPGTTPTPSDPSAPVTSTPSIPSTSSTPTASTPSTPSSTGTSWPTGKDGWTVVVFGYDDQARANQRAADLQEDGFESGVLFSTDFGSLCPGFYVVFSGVYDTKNQADNQMKRLQGKYQGMYVKKIAKDGSAQGCTS